MPQEINAFASVGVQILFAAEANNLRRWSLERAGHDLVAVVMGKTATEAELRYFRDWHAAISAHTRRVADGDDVQIAYRRQADEPIIGLFPGEKPA